MARRWDALKLHRDLKFRAAGADNRSIFYDDPIRDVEAAARGEPSPARLRVLALDVSRIAFWYGVTGAVAVLGGDPGG